MRRVHLVRTALTAALLGVAALIAAPAAAGGPTSALLSIPGAGSTASLYYTDPEYDELADLVGVSQPSGTFDTELGTHESGPGITITWLIHDVDPWRVDRVYLGGEDGPWISTQMASGNASIWESPVRWHQPRGRCTAGPPARRVGAGHRRFQEHRLRGGRRCDRAEHDHGAGRRTRRSSQHRDRGGSGASAGRSVGWSQVPC